MSFKTICSEQKQLIAQFKALKSNKFSKSSAYIKIATIANDAFNDGTIAVILANGKLKCNAILDSGADATLISSNILNKLRSFNGNLQIESVKPPLTLQLPNSDSAEINRAINIDMK